MLTALVALAVLGQAPAPKVIEMTDSVGAAIVGQIHLVSDEEDPALPVLGEVIAAQSDPSQPTTVVVLPGMMRVETKAPAHREQDVVNLLCRSVASLMIDEDGAEKALKHARRETQGYVIQSRWGFDPIGPGDPDQLLTGSLARATAPGNYFIVGQGDFEPGAMSKAIVGLIWPSGRQTNASETRHPGKALMPDGVEAVQWRGKALKPGSIEWTQAVVASCALGSGPGGVLQEVCRRTNAWSYDQEAVLWPTRSGFVPVVSVFRKSGSETKAADVQKALTDKVDALSATDLARAAHMAKNALQGDPRWSPVLVAPDLAYTASRSDKVTWRGFGEIWGSSTALPKMFVQPVEQVTLDQLKKTCREWLNDSRRQVLD